MLFSTVLAGARRFRAHTLATISTLLFVSSPLAHAQTGGFLELPLSLSTAVEPLLSSSEINSFLPSKGNFTFPAPYNTQAVRLTNGADCGGSDCVFPVGYSYWRNINNHVGSNTMLIMLGFNKSKGGAGLSLLEYNKVTGALTNRGPLFDANSQYGYASGEGWYFSATMPTKIYVSSLGKIQRYDVNTKQFETVVDITAHLGANHVVHQMHSSNDDRVHSATVRNGSTYAVLGCMAYESDTKKFHYFPKKGDYDECQVDKSGRWLVIKENVDGAEGEDNRIIDLTNDSERLLRDSDGAGGHSDLGYGYMLASDNWAPAANTSKIWDFTQSTLKGTRVYANTDWNVDAPNHLSHTNARNAPAAQQYACGSSANRRNSSQANEIVCFMLDGSSRTVVVAPTMVNLDSRKTASGDYDNMPKGNLDVTGQYFIWTSNMGGSRVDAFLVKIPSQLLTGSSAVDTTGGGTSTGGTSGSTVTPPSTTAPAPAPVTAPITETVVNLAAPVISGLSATNLSATTATIKWTTNKPVVQHVDYGTTTNYTMSSPINGSYLSSHEVVLTGLETSKLYHYRALMRDEAGNLTISPDLTFTTGAAGTTAPATTTPPPTTQPDTSTTSTTPGGVSPVKWIELANAAGDGNGTIRRSSGCDGCADSGAASEQLIANVGYLEFAPTVESALRFIGLSDRNGDNTAADIDFGLRLQGNVVEVRENGIYRGDTTFNAGDILRISVANGKVSYLRNGSVFYTSMTTPAASLRADAALYGANSGVNNVKISGGTATGAAPAPAGTGTVTWINPVKVSVSGTSVQKTSGCDGCPDAGTVSAEQIMSGNGSVEFKVTIEENKLRIVGLTGIGATDVAYGFSLTGAKAEVREKGVYRAATAVAAGDTLRVTVENGIVSYAKNGVAFFTSPTRATATLRAGALFYSTGGTVRDAVIKTQ